MTGDNRGVTESSVGDSRGIVRGGFDWSATTPSTAVVELVGQAADSDPTAVGPLYDAVDPDALDQIVRSTATELGGEPLTVSFTFADHEVTVSSDGAVAVRPATEG